MLLYLQTIRCVFHDYLERFLSSMMTLQVMGRLTPEDVRPVLPTTLS